MMKSVVVDKIASVTQAVGLGHELRISTDIPAEEGVIVVVEVLTNKSTYNTLELTSGRMAKVGKGDIVAGALGHRKALFGYSGHVPETLAAGDVIQMLNIGGVLGVCDSVNPDKGKPFDCRVLGVVLQFPYLGERIGVPALAVRAVLAVASSDGRSYAERLEGVKTERELSELYEDFVERVPLGRSFLAERNPVRTGGPMQVGVAFAEEQVRAQRYPYPLRGSVRHEVFTRRGGLYFGAAHLLAYRAPYAQMIYRFADFNAGRWASRNVAFQQALARLSGRTLVLDGDLLPPPGANAVGQTEAAALALAGRLDLSPEAVRRQLAQGTAPDFEASALYRRVFEQADAQAARALPRALLPRIDLQSPKFTRKLSTEWFARRVDERYQRCLARIEALQAG